MMIQQLGGDPSLVRRERRNVMSWIMALALAEVVNDTALVQVIDKIERA
jgi:hypothetical protein